MSDLVVAIGGSVGGLSALLELGAPLSPEFPGCLAVVLHRGSGSVYAPESLESLLQRHLALDVVSTESGSPLEDGKLYLAPASYHLLVSKTHADLSSDAPVRYSRPSIDVLFESLAFSEIPSPIAILLSCANTDGVDGLSEVKRAGGMVIVQEPATCVSSTAVEAALTSVDVDRVMTPAQIGDYLTTLNPAPPPPAFLH